VVGNPGEFTIWVDDAMVIEKQGGRFPDPKEVIAAVRSRRS
jgi:predicted Rdx family selenoprotein